MNTGKTMRVGIGFATGRKSFQKVLKAYVYNWLESGLTEMKHVYLDVLVAYDLKYRNTKVSDYTNMSKDILELIGDTYFIGNEELSRDTERLIAKNVLSEKQAQLLFGSGYAAKRNAVLYTALKNNLDYLLFLDDDEYPVAVTNTRSSAVWGGQQVLKAHLEQIGNADLTNGHHCGYISPIPFIRFNDTMTEADFKMFIEAISNDIVNWDTIRSVMDNGGVTYADTKILTSGVPEEVPEVKHAKFISGANLCINLTRPDRVFPFFNPPGARGEDSFLSTCLSGRSVFRVPCYTFHDGFSTYRHLMDGVLPIRLKTIEADSKQIIDRFYKACVGWVRYKPLLLYITQRAQYETQIRQMKENLALALPKICAYFETNEFMNVLKELERYDKNVTRHYEQFLETQLAWQRITEDLESGRANA